jgi:hypothetical protein
LQTRKKKTERGVKADFHLRDETAAYKVKLKMKAEMKRFNPTILVREEIFQKQNLTMPTRPPARLLKNPAIQKGGASLSSINSKMN